MFKKITLVLVMALALNARAQFTIDEDTLYCYGFAGSTSSDFVDIYAHTVIRSTASSTETINWSRINNALPGASWSTAICDIISCRAPEVSTDSFSFPAGDTGILSFHFYTKDLAGNGWMTVRFSRVSNPLDYIDVVINARAWNPLGIKRPVLAATNVYPNPAANKVKFENTDLTNGTLSVYNALGQLMVEMPFISGMELDIQSLASGIYSCTIESQSGISNAGFVKS